MNKKHLAFLYSCFAFSVSLAQSITNFNGKVIFDNDKTPAIGAYVTVQGTKATTITDVNGNFSFQNLPEKAKLVISYVGMMSKEVTAQSGMTVALNEDAHQLDDVIVVAYGTQKRSSVTGSISSIGAKSISERPNTSVTGALEGSVSGIQVNSSYGQPGADPEILVRGFTTINGSNRPLYILDGMPFGGNISDINSEDIENISVLKDAASAALYGNRASNGVILITTKKGRGGKPHFDLNIRQGLYTSASGEYDRLGADKYMEAMYTGIKNSEISKGATAEKAAETASKNIIPSYLYLNIYDKADDQLFDANGKLQAKMLKGYEDDLDWFDQAKRNGYRQEYNLSASGSGEKTNYLFSVGYLDENGFLLKSGFERYSARAKMDLQPVSWLKSGFNIAATYQNIQNSRSDDPKSMMNTYLFATRISPIYPVHQHNADGSYIYDENGNMQYDGGNETRNQYTGRHLIMENECDKNKMLRTTVNTQFYMSAYFLNNFTFTVNGNLNIRNQSYSRYSNSQIGSGLGADGYLYRTDYKYRNYTVQQQLSWQKQIGTHFLDVLLDHENYSDYYDYYYGSKSNEAVQGGDFISNFSEIVALNGYDSDYRTESYLGRMRYNYNDTYNAELSFRRDGSSRFSKKNRWGNFWSLGGSWVISNEEFMKNINFVDNLKLRASYGEVGNDQSVGRFAYMALYTINQNAGYTSLYKVQNMADKIKWEHENSFGIGIDARLFNRWNISAEYFDKTSKDLLFDMYLPLSGGSTGYEIFSEENILSRNIGSVSNRGIEISTDVDIYRNKDWRVNIGANATIMKNKITSLPAEYKDGAFTSETSLSGIQYKFQKGKPMYQIYTAEYAGVDQMDGQALYTPDLENCYIKDTENNITVGNENGTKISAFKCINGEYYLTSTTNAKKIVAGNAIPKMFGAFTPSVSYKSLSLSAVLTYQLGGKMYDATYADLMANDGAIHALSTDISKSWSEIPNGMTETSADRIDPNGIPQNNLKNSAANNAASSRFIVSSDYFMIKNINLSYSLPKEWLKSVDLENVTLSGTIENLGIFTARKGLNSQQNFSKADVYASGNGNPIGINYYYLTAPRIFTIGINIKL